MGIMNILGFGKSNNTHLSENDKTAISFLNTLLNRIETFKNSDLQVHKDNLVELTKVVKEFKQTIELSKRELVKLNIKDSQMLNIDEFKFTNSNFHSEIIRLEHSLNELATKVELIIHQIHDDSKAQHSNNLRQQRAVADQTETKKSNITQTPKTE